MIFTIISFIGAAAQATHGTIDQIHNRKAARLAAEAQRNFAKSEREAAQLYNSPKAQMERFKDANLNPNLIYGQGQAAAGEYVPQDPAGQGGEFQQIDTASSAGPLVGGIYDFQKHKAGMDLMEQQTRKLHQDNDFAASDYITRLRHLSNNAMNASDKLHYDTQIRHMEQQTMKEERNAYAKLGTDKQKDGTITYDKTQEIRTKGTANVVGQIENINTTIAANKLIREQTTNQAAANKRIKEFEKILNKYKSQGNISLQDAIQMALYYILTK